MGKIDKFINNRAPKKVVFVFGIMLIFSALMSLILSEKLADFTAHKQLEMYLLTVDSEKVSRYGLRADMPLELLPVWHETKRIAFILIFLCMGISSVCWAVFSVREFFGIYDSLELISRDCINSANKLTYSISMQGSDGDCVRRISEGAELLASRINHLNKRLEHEKNYLREFLNTFSHQIKTSLAVIRLNTDILAETQNISEEQREELNNEIELNLDGMEMLVIQAIKFARLETDTIDYKMQNLCFADTCRTAVRRILPVFREKNIIVTAELPENIFLNHDKGWLCEAVENILKNSADHSDCTEIALNLEENPAMIKLSVQDNGRGIPQKDIPHLFEPFSRKSSDINMKSAGLGMSIAQKIVRSHGGEIVVYSGTGRGTEFDLVFIKS